MSSFLDRLKGTRTQMVSPWKTFYFLIIFRSDLVHLPDPEKISSNLSAQSCFRNLAKNTIKLK